MPVYHSVQGQLVTHGEFLARSSDLGTQLQSFEAVTVGATPGGREFVNIDFAQPLSVMIRHVYTGKYPEHHLFSSRKPMLLASAVKDVTTTSAAARAVNMLKQSVSPGSLFPGPAAQEEGTPIVYYSPAIASPLITIGVQLVFQDFPSELFDHVGQLFSNLSGVPIFMPASGYLMGAATLVKLAGDIGDSLMNGHPVLDETLQLDFSFGGGAIPKPGFWVLSPSPLDPNDYQFDPNRGLIHRASGERYDGDDPVVVLSVDGRKQDALANFSPLMASASMLGRFFSQKPSSEVMMDSLLSAVKLYNDLTYRKKAEDVQKQVAALPAGSPDIAKLQEQLSAFNANIGEQRLRI